LSLNSLSISVTFKAKEIFKKKLSERESWVNAPFAKEVGQTDNLNHFVWLKKQTLATYNAESYGTNYHKKRFNTTTL
jgi:hypothetical protein